jgi:CelD/BcsL family acetyltransferase involved in cellulose biosynthesis
VTADILNTFAGLEALYYDSSNGLRWPHVFSLPGWMKAWWQYFGGDYEPQVLTLRRGGQVVGIAPFKRLGRTASFIGDASVCDYLDFIAAPGNEQVFSEMLIGECAARGIARLELGTLRPDSVAARYVLPFARSRGFTVNCRDADVTYELELPDTYEEYLGSIAAKQRHELLRKQRNLEMEGRAAFRLLRGSEVTDTDIGLFIDLMARSRSDKAGFLTETMRAFLRDAVRAGLYGFLRLGFLDLGAKPVAAVLGFDYNNIMYLYNSGYDPAYADLSVGLISKLAFIRHAVEQHKRVFDFLKGPEVYKERLGGKPVGLSACDLTLG